jgi:hypothetical protein
MIAVKGFAMLVVLGVTLQAQAQESKLPYPSMAPLDQYLTERNAEIALARSAAPPSISQDAEVMVLGRHGYETAVKGKNGFVCIVERSWTAGIDAPIFGIPNFGPRSVSIRRPHDPTFHSPSRKPSGYCLGPADRVSDSGHQVVGWNSCICE